MHPLKDRNFALYFCSNTLAMLGFWMMRLVLGWLGWQYTQSTFLTSLIVMALMLPSGFLGPFVAVYAENWSMRIASAIISVAITITIVLFWLIEITGHQNTISLLSVSILLGLLIAVYHPIRLVYISLIAPKKVLSHAVAMNALSFNACRIVGPAISSLMILELGAGITLLVGAICHLPLIWAQLVVPISLRKRLLDKQGFWHRMQQGINATLGDKLIVFALMMVFINSFFIRAAVEIQPAIVGQVFGGDSSDLAVVTVASGVGSLSSAFIISQQKFTHRHLRKTIFPTLLAGLGITFSQSLAPYFISEVAISGIWFMAIIYGLMGFCLTMVGVSSQAIVQLQVKEQFRARVMTRWSPATFASISLGGVVLGLIGDIVPILDGMGGLTIIGSVGLLGWLGWFRRQ